ncbi:hypothetical protein [Chromobacterium sp. ASV23]|nr:hypothetical protein [Chromobacterium sp. ASV23]
MSGQISRISAERDMRSLQIAIAAQSGEAAQKLIETLEKEYGEPPVKFDQAQLALNEQPDQEGLAFLKTIA